MEPIPIRTTNAEAAAIVAREHNTTVLLAISDDTKRSKCACGWRSEALATATAAESAGRAHMLERVEEAIAARRRFAIFYEKCAECKGTGEVSAEAWAILRPTAEAVDDDTECPECVEGGLWVAVDRKYDERAYGDSIDDAFDGLAEDYEFDPEHPCGRDLMEPTA